MEKDKLTFVLYVVLIFVIGYFGFFVGNLYADHYSENFDQSKVQIDCDISVLGEYHQLNFTGLEINSYLYKAEFFNSSLNYHYMFFEGNNSFSVKYLTVRLSNFHVQIFKFEQSDYINVFDQWYQISS